MRVTRHALISLLVVGTTISLTPHSAAAETGGESGQGGSNCTYTLLPASQSMIAGGGSSSTAVLAPSGCAWTAVSNADSWLTITGPTSGTGDGTIMFAAAANSNAQARVGTLTIADQTFTLSQAGAPCIYFLSSTGSNVPSGGGTASTTVTSPTGCTWTAVSNSSWLTVTAGATGNGTGTVTLSAAANTSQARTGSAAIAGQTFTVFQPQGSSNCTFTISPTSLSMSAAGGNGSTSVTTTSSCSWVATSNSAWITVTGGASGTGTGTTTFTVAANASAVQRVGILTIAGKTLAVTQAANTCTYTLSPTNRTVTSAADSGTVAVTTTTGCAWSATSNQAWISASGSGTASGSVSYLVGANTSSSSRSGTITIGMQVFTITQTGAPTTVAVPQGLRIVGGGN